MFKKIILLILFVCVLYSTYSQRKLKYKDIYDVVLANNIEQAYSLLTEYQKIDPEFPNTYFQLGLISFDWTKDADPLTQMSEVEYFIYNSTLFLGLAKTIGAVLFQSVLSLSPIKALEA